MEENNIQEIEAPEGNGKTFTSEEVSSIVQKRLASYRKSVSKDIEAEYQEKYKALSDREVELNKREKDFTLKSALSERGMPQELAGIITFTDTEDLNAKLEQLNAIYGPKENKKESETEPATAQSLGFHPIGSGDGDDMTRSGFGIAEAFKYKGRL